MAQSRVGFFVFIIGAVLALIQHTGTINVFINMLLHKFGDSPMLLSFILFVFIAWFAYFLQGGAPRSNTNPWDIDMTPDNEWMEVQVTHVGIVYPDKALLEGLATDPNDGGPWVMWIDTPYVHIMLPMPKHVPGKD